MRRRRRSSGAGLFFALLIGGGLVGASVWLDRRGETVLAPVQAKHERVTPRRDPQGTWYRWYELGVGVGDAGAAPWTATVEVSQQRYDSIQLGDSVQVRYLPQLPLFARTADRSTATVAREAAVRTGILALLFWVGGGIAALWIAARIGTPLVIASGLAWMAAGFPLLLRAPSPPAPAASEGRARVAAVTVITKSPERGTARRRSRLSRSSSTRRLAMPYQVVQLHVPLPGGRDSVLAVDAVDSGSVAGLTHGAILPIRYDPRTPRHARLAQGARTYLDRNRYHYRTAVIGLPLLGMLVAYGFRVRRRRTPPADRAAG